MSYFKQLVRPVDLLFLLTISACDISTHPIETAGPIKTQHFGELKIAKLNTYMKGFRHPTEIQVIDDQIWLAQFKDDQIYRLSDLSKADLQPVIAIDSNGLAEPVKSPHFFAKYKNGVFVSEGRGDSLIFYDLSSENRGDEVVGVKVKGLPELDRPHGLCIDQDDWLYIADSANSRLLRKHLGSGKVELFKDVEKVIGYSRQLLCRKDGVWISNSFHDGFNLNQGAGSDVLRVTDFASGLTENIISFHDTGTTGLAVIDDRYLLVGRWLGKRDILVFDLKKEAEAGAFTYRRGRFRRTLWNVCRP